MSDAVRVVAVRSGRLRPAEFTLRQGEAGLSMFLCETDEDVRLVVEAVRAAGKSGHLAAAAITAEDVTALGLVLVHTAGGTPDEAANQLHVEARLSEANLDLARRMGQEPFEFFNQQLAGAIHARARVVYES